MVANLQGAMNGGARGDGGGLLPAPAGSSSQAIGSSSVSTAIVPYQVPHSRGANDVGGNFGDYGNRGNNNGYRGYQGYGGQRYSKPWNGGYRDRDRDERFDKIYSLLSEQAEERERKKQEAGKLELFEAEKKRLQAEEEKNAQTRKEKELHEARLGKIVRGSMKSVCESVLGKKVDIPDEDETEISRVRRELEELKARCACEKAESSLDALRREKEALQKGQSMSSEEVNLRREVEMLRARNDKSRLADVNSDGSRCDEIAALRLQILELEGVRTALQDRSSELSHLRSENSALKKDFLDLKGEIAELKSANNKRTSDVVTEKSPSVGPDAGKQKMVPIGEAVYTPKDLDALRKAFKKAQAGEEMANKEVQALKERMARLGNEAAAIGEKTGHEEDYTSQLEAYAQCYQRRGRGI
ncbi:hypothetical protein CBR_g51459 [Chara braunii]|uniref:Uncharacterized protein n=1 Tax=Chara braunii TaxID=69332 RepID=A0A388K6A9_CHABU|nr:hypothetical protein CBR_g51459 [Chara braunii]|eukprot:GBG65577.1 hypothetical protein CBR_g51459 [Chara braunii]